MPRAVIDAVRIRKVKGREGDGRRPRAKPTHVLDHENGVLSAQRHNRFEPLIGVECGRVEQRHVRHFARAAALILRERRLRK